MSKLVVAVLIVLFLLFAQPGFEVGYYEDNSLQVKISLCLGVTCQDSIDAQNLGIICQDKDGKIMQCSQVYFPIVSS